MAKINLYLPMKNQTSLILAYLAPTHLMPTISTTKEKQTTKQKTKRTTNKLSSMLLPTEANIDDVARKK